MIKTLKYALEGDEKSEVALILIFEIVPNMNRTGHEYRKITFKAGWYSGKQRRFAILNPQIQILMVT